MPGASPSPSKRPSLAERSSSTHSLSSSGRPGNGNANANKGQRVHVVSKHQRNISHGKGLNKLGKVASNANVTADGKQRKKSGPITPAESPRSALQQAFKRNSSHAGLPKNTSNTNLRKNHSAGALSSKRNRSHGALSKLGAPPAQKTKENEKKQGFFALGDQSSGEEDEEEWEDSNTQSPELSRNQSKASTPLRPRTPINELHKPPDSKLVTEIKASDLPEPSLGKGIKSEPNLKQAPKNELSAEPALLQGQSRSSRAPPVMSTASVRAVPGNIPRSDSARSLSKLAENPRKSSNMNDSTPVIGTASSGSGGVSHFLQASSVATSAKTFDTGSDEDSTAGGFMAHYRPLQPDSPEKPRSMLNKIQSRAAPSRTNQKMELQRRETMRAGAAAAATQGPVALNMNAGSAVSLHSRSGSKGGIRNRSLAGEMKALKQDYESAIKQLTVVRRFRNPVLESLHRLQENDVIPSDAGVKSQASSQTKSRPQSRRGVAASSTNTPKVNVARSPEDKKTALSESRSDGQARPGRVQFQLSRQGSHDDIGLTTSQGSPGEFDDEQDGVSPEEALIRRIWESRMVYENDGVQTTG